MGTVIDLLCDCCMCVCVRACVRACVHVCGHVCVVGGCSCLWWALYTLFSISSSSHVHIYILYITWSLSQPFESQTCSSNLVCLPSCQTPPLRSQDHGNEREHQCQPLARKNSTCYGTKKTYWKNVFELLIPIIIVPGPGNKNSTLCWQKENYFLNVSDLPIPIDIVECL